MSDTYDLESLELPRLVGLPLKLFAEAVENPVTAKALLGTLQKNAGVDKLRALEIDEPPTYYPLHPSSDAEEPIGDVGAWFESARSKTTVPFATVRDYAEAYRRGDITPEEVAERVLQAIDDSDRGDKPLRAFIAIDRDDVMRQARESAKRFAEGKPLGPLDGVPVAVKDEVDMVPYGTTVGTKFLGKEPAREDATVVARMRAAGALLFGKTNMHEIGISVTGLNPHHGVARNPYDPDHFTGGSSSGSAAAVAAGFCPVAIGADGGGSIRIPSSFCGVVGLKGTFGRVSGFGAAPLDWTVGHLGPIAATAEDAAIAYAVMAGPDPKDPLSLQHPDVSLQGFDDLSLKGLKLGIYMLWFEHAESETVATCKAALKDLQSAGAEVVEITISELDPARLAHALIILSEMASAMDRYYKEHRRDFGLEARVSLALARSFTAKDYVQSQRVRTRSMRIFMDVLSKVDVIVTPTTALPAPEIPVDALPDGESDLSKVTEIMRFAFPANLTGLPAITFPVGYTGEGLPVGLQAMGRPWSEALLLRIAHVAEQFVERRRPAVFTNPLEAME